MVQLFFVRENGSIANVFFCFVNVVGDSTNCLSRYCLHIHYHTITLSVLLKHIYKLEHVAESIPDVPRGTM